jgi:hypothetical protein
MMGVVSLLVPKQLGVHAAGQVPLLLPCFPFLLILAFGYSVCKLW